MKDIIQDRRKLNTKKERVLPDKIIEYMRVLYPKDSFQNKFPEQL